MNKHALLWLISFALLITTSLRAQDAPRVEPFEGQVTYLLEMKPRGVEAEQPLMRMRMQMQIKGGKAKMNAAMSMRGASLMMEMLMLNGQQESYLIDHDSRSAKRLPFDSAQVNAAKNAKVERFERVGTDTALGVTGSVYEMRALINGVNAKMRMLVYEKVEFSSEFMATAGMPSLPNVPQVRGLPLRLQMDMELPQGSVVMTMRCLEFKLRPVDDATVTLPKDYTIEAFTR